MSNKINSLKGFDGFVLDTEKKILWHEDTPVKLPLKAVELLCVLIENCGEVVSKNDLLDKVWQRSFVEEGILSQNVYRLRKVFKQYGNEKDLIQTIPRRGYRFSSNISEIFEEEIFIEQTAFEKKIIAERNVSDEEFNEAISDFESTRNLENTTPKQISTKATHFRLSKKTFTILLISAFSLVAIGTSFWFWQRSNSHDGNSKKILFIKPDSVEFERITDTGKAFFPAVSRDNKNLAYVKPEDGKWSIILRNISTGSETVVVEPQEFELRSLNFSADGNHIFYVSRLDDSPGSTVYQIPIYGGASRKLLTGVRHHFSISRSGDRLAFFRLNPKKNETYLMTASIDGSSEKLISIRKPSEFYAVWGTYPDWSHDDKKLVVSAYTRGKVRGTPSVRRYLLEIDVKTGEEKRIKTPDWDFPHQAFWLNDGSGFLVAAQEKPNDPRQIWYLEYPSGKAKRITNDTNSYKGFRTTFDTKTIYAMNRKVPGNLYLIDLEGSSEIKQITKEMTRSNGHSGLVWTKDGKNIVFVKSEELGSGHIWKINLETKQQQQLTFDNEKSIYKVELMPDGNSILFGSNRSGSWHIWKVGIDGRNLEQFTDGIVETSTTVTSDGKWLLYREAFESPNQLKKRPLEGGESSLVLKNVAVVIKVSPTDSDKAVIGYNDPTEEEGSRTKCVLISIDSGEILKDLGFVHIQPTFEWSRDGKGIYFPKINSLWYLSLEDEKLSKITKFKDMRIVNLSTSPDGKTLAITGEDRTSDILKIEGFQQH